MIENSAPEPLSLHRKYVSHSDMIPCVIEEHGSGSKNFVLKDFKRPKIINNKDLKDVVETNSSGTCVKFTRRSSMVRSS